MNEHQNLAGEVPLSKFAADLSPVLWQMRWKARLLATGRAPLPPGARARLARLAAKLEPLEMARLITDEVYLVTDDPPRKSLVYAFGGSPFSDRQVHVSRSAAPSFGRNSINPKPHGDDGQPVMQTQIRVTPARFAELEGMAQKTAQAEAERLFRDSYKRIADRSGQRIGKNVLRKLGDGSRYRFIGSRGDALSEPIAARLVDRYLVKPWAESITLLPADSDDQERVWRDVFVGCTPDESGRLDVVKSPRRGRPNTTKARVREYLDQKYPNGTDATISSLVDELKAAKIFASPTTVERALERRRDSDRSSKARPK